MREFTIAAKSAATKDGDTFGEDVPIKMDDGREVVFLPATEAQIALLIGADLGSDADRVATTVNFFFGLIRDTADHTYFKRRLLSRDDKFDTEAVSELLMILMEEWTGNPTQPSSDSTPSPKSTGERSTGTARAKGSTRSSSRRTDSSA